MERSSYKTCQTGTTSNCHFVKSQLSSKCLLIATKPETLIWQNVLLGKKVCLLKCNTCLLSGSSDNDSVCCFLQLLDHLKKWFWTGGKKMTVIEKLSPFLFCYIFHVGPTSGFLLLHDFEEFRPVSIWLSDPHFGVSQPSGRVAACGAGEDDSCHLLSRKYTRDPPHSKHPNARLPFLSTASHHPLVQFSPENLTTGSNYFPSRSRVYVFVCR